MSTNISKMMEIERKKRKARENRQFSNNPKWEKVTKKGKLVDVIIRFGKEWKGQLVSQMLYDPMGVGYITNFIMNPANNFPEEMREDIRTIMVREGFDADCEEDIPW